MSLLMDALKRAEQEKKEAAKRLREAQGDVQDDNLDISQESRQESALDDRTLTQELSTEKLSTTGESIQPSGQGLELSPSDSSSPNEQGSKLDDTAEIDGLTLSPVEDRHMVLENLDDSSEVASDVDVTGDVSLPGVPMQDLSSTDSHATDASLSDSEALTSTPALENTQTSPDAEMRGDYTLSSTDNIELEVGEVTSQEKTPGLDQTMALTDFQDDEELSKVDDITRAEQEFEGVTGEADDEYEYFSATVSAAQLAKDIGRDSPTPVAAQTVFTATASKPGSQVWQWGAFVGLCLAIAVSLTLFIFNYTVPTDHSVKSPLVARDVEKQSEAMPDIEIPEEFIADIAFNSELFSGEINDARDKTSDVSSDTGQTETGLTETEQMETGQAETEVTNIAGAAAAEPVDDQLAMVNEKELAQVAALDRELAKSANKTLPEDIVLEPRLIKISRSTSTDKRSVLINQAYEEYLEGDYVAAEATYRDVLKSLPENRDALLGLAAISSHKGQIHQAYTYYLEVLKLYPGDSVAEAALINFKRDGDYARNESTLKTFLRKEPENPFLHYSLGRLYAAQKRWPEAQKSFFDAYSINTANPDYAFNLAVSLDHIGQRQSAMDYYQTALELADNPVSAAGVGFDRGAVITRISALSSSGNLQPENLH